MIGQKITATCSVRSVTLNALCHPVTLPPCHPATLSRKVQQTRDDLVQIAHQLFITRQG
jgi:hypothetical protein